MARVDTSQRRLSAIMFSDICGYSRLMGQDEARAMAVLAHHDKVVNAGISKFQGKIIKRMGDGVLAEFPSAVGAVDCALAIQRHMRAHNNNAPADKRFELRIGVHLGDVVVTGDDILGDGVNVASRIEPLALPGGICISQDVYNQIQNKIEVEVVSLGPRQLKNIRRQIEIFRVLIAAADTDRAEAGTPGHAPAARQSTGMPVWAWVVAAASLLILLVVSARMLGMRRRARERAAVNAAVEEAYALSEEARFADARGVLEKAIGEVRPGTPGLDNVRERIEQAADQEQKVRIRRRYAQFMKAILHRDMAHAATFIDAESKRRHGPNGVRFLMKALSMATSSQNLSPRDIRIHEVHLEDDRTSATVIPEVCRQGVWRPAKPARWRLREDEWYVVLGGRPK